MKRRPKNHRMTSYRDRRKQYFVEGVVKRGTNATWSSVRQWTGRLFKVLVLVAVAGGICYGATAGWRKYFWENPEYALRDITYTTDGTLTREQACAVGKIQPGANILSYKTGAVRDALRTLPQVESAEVTRYLPNRIEITVHERTPVAWLAGAGGEKSPEPEPAHLLDASGIVFHPRSVRHEFRALPVISGVETGNLVAGKPILRAEVRAALELLKRARETGAFKVMAIDVSRAYCLVATDQKHAQLTFGLDDIAGQLERLGAVRGEAALIGQEIQTINLIPVRNIPVTFVQPPPPEDDEAADPAPAAHADPKAKAGSAAAAAGKAKPKPPHKHDEPPKARSAPKNDGTGLLKRFRTA